MFNPDGPFTVTHNNDYTFNGNWHLGLGILAFGVELFIRKGRLPRTVMGSVDAANWLGVHPLYHLSYRASVLLLSNFILKYVLYIPSSV